MKKKDISDISTQTENEAKEEKGVQSCSSIMDQDQDPTKLRVKNIPKANSCSLLSSIEPLSPNNSDRLIEETNLALGATASVYNKEHQQLLGQEPDPRECDEIMVIHDSSFKVNYLFCSLSDRTLF